MILKKCVFTLHLSSSLSSIQYMILQAKIQKWSKYSFVNTQSVVKTLILIIHVTVILNSSGCSSRILSCNTVIIQSTEKDVNNPPSI